MSNVFLKDNYKVRVKLACSSNETSCFHNTFDTIRICNTSPKQETTKSLIRIDVLELFNISVIKITPAAATLFHYVKYDIDKT